MWNRRLGLVTIVALASGAAVVLRASTNRRSSAAAELRPNEVAVTRLDGGSPRPIADTLTESRMAVAGRQPRDEREVELVRPDGEDSARAVALLEAIVAESDLATQLAALHELAGLEGESAPQSLAAVALDPSLPVRLRREAMLLLASQRGEVAYETCLELLRADELDLRLAAAQGLGMLADDRALGTLSEAFAAESSAAVARAIVQSMSRLGTPAAVESLLRYSWSDALPPGMNESEVLGALSGVSNPEALAALTQGLEQVSDTASRRALVSALAKIADPSSLQLLLSIVGGDPDLDTRCEAMQGLGLIGDEHALPMLRDLAATGSVKEQSYAETAIQRIEAGA